MQKNGKSTSRKIIRSKQTGARGAGCARFASLPRTEAPETEAATAENRETSTEHDTSNSSTVNHASKPIRDRDTTAQALVSPASSPLTETASGRNDGRAIEQTTPLFRRKPEEGFRRQNRERAKLDETERLYEAQGSPLSGLPKRTPERASATRSPTDAQAGPPTDTAPLTAGPTSARYAVGRGKPQPGQDLKNN